MKTSRGFTLIELLMTIVIAAIVLGFAVPSFQLMLENNRLVTQVNEVVSAVNMARSESIKRGTNVTMTAAAGFQNGWCIHAGLGCGTADELRVFDAMNGITLTAVDAVPNPVTTMVFDARGMRLTPGAAAGQVVITMEPQGCATGEVRRARQINIGTSGRANVTTVNCP